MSTLLLLSLLSAEPGISAGAPGSDVPKVMVFAYPAATGLGAAYGVSQRGTYLYLPLGVSVPVSANLSIDLELEGSYNQNFSSTGWSLAASAGPTWFPWARRGNDGFFVGPRFAVEISRPLPEVVLFDGCPVCASSEPLDFGNGVRRAFLLGFDVGWQFRFGRVVLAPIVGLAVGYAYDNREAVLTPFDREILFGNRPLPNGFATAVNFKLLRLGGAF